MNKLKMLFVLLLPITLLGQQNIEIGGFAGFANYQGDLAPKNIEISETKVSFGGFIRYHLTDKVKIRANGYLGFISGSDFNDKNGTYRDRGWSFESKLFEASLMGEYHPLGRSRSGETGIFRRQISPYVFAGVGMVNADPTVSVTLPEDEGLFPEKGFEPTHLVIPYGIGVRADLLEFVSLGFEGGYRLTFDDYLDGVKENGVSNRDLYFFVGATLSVFFGSIEAYDFVK
ncbi:MAG: DUF6089 family protein [Saprospiraceae bacterium]